MNRKKTSSNYLYRKIEEFEKANPELSKTLRLLDISIREYNEALNALEPITTYTTNSTVAK